MKRLLFTLFFCLPLIGNSAQLSFVLEDPSLKELILEIEFQSDFKFAYGNDIKIETILFGKYSFQDEDLENIVKTLSVETPFTFKILSNNIAITKDKVATNTEQPTAQNTVRGSVVDAETGMPVPSANVIEKGTSNGVMTDFDGEFTIEVPEGAILEVSYIGYATTEIEVDGQTELEIGLQPEASALEEVVVVGYGTVNRSDVTGSISQISSKDFERVPATNPLESLQGRVPGLQISSSSGQPGAGLNVMIRGMQSINGTNSPIFVVDGTITESINNINPQDIESFSVLKDASAVAIYGSRASNGVILVTTKRGKGKDLSISFNTQQSIQEEGNQSLDFLNAEDWLRLLTEGYENAGQTIPWTDEDLAEYEGVSVIWPDIVKRTGIMSTYDLSVTGGGEKSNYFISASYLDNEGIIKGENYNRMNFRINTDHEITDRLTFGNSLNIFSSTRNLNRDYDGRNLYESSLRYTPLNRMYAEDGDFATIGDVRFESIGPSPLWMMENTASDWKSKGLIGNLYLTIDLFDGLSFTTRGSAEWTHGYGTSFVGAMDPKYQMAGANVNQVEKHSNQTLHWISDFLLNYNKVFSEIHSVNAVAGYSLEEDSSEGLMGSRGGTPNNNIRFLNAGDPETALNANGYTDWAIKSLFARLGYSYKEKYIFSGAVRRDGTSRFSDGNKFGTFPALSAAWRVTEEGFMNQIDWLNELKLRASWGIVGNSLGVSPYGTAHALNQRNYVMNQNVVLGYTLANAINTDLSWESTAKKNFGFDAYFFDSQLYLISDFFIEDTHDLLFQQPIPYSTGLSGSPFINAGHVRNKGIEIELGYRKLSGDWSYDFSANISHIRNEVIDLEGRDLRTSGIAEGYPIGTPFGYKTNGLIRTQEELDNNPHLSGKGIGDIWFMDIDGYDSNGELTGEPDGIVDEADRTLIGDPFPDLNFGLFGSIGYKNFTMQMHIQGASGFVKNMRSGRYVTDLFTSQPNMEADFIIDRFHPENNPEGQYPRVSIDDQGQNTQTSDFWLIDASHISIRNVNLNYSFSNSLKETLSLNDLSIFAGVHNLYTFGDVYAEINEVVDVPIPRKWTLGLRVKF